MYSRASKLLELSKQITETRNNTKPYSKNKNVLRFQDIFPSKTLKSKELRNEAGLNSRLKIHELCQPAIIDCTVPNESNIVTSVF